MPVSATIVAAGNYFIQDNGIVGDNISVIADADGNTLFTFAHPADAVNITVGVPGVNITVNLTDSLGTADFNLGNLTNPAASPDSITVRNIVTTGDVALVSNGFIREGGADAGVDIRAASIVLSAVSGVGTGANAIETQAGQLEAETTTGGISLSNLGSVQIGGITDEVSGLDVVTSGNLNFTANGSIFLGDETGFESVGGGSASGNVFLTATGFNSDIIANVDNDAISAARGNITLTAGRDISFGIIGANFDNDVRANGNVTVNAGRDFNIDGFADLVSDDFGQGTGGDVIINAGRNIAMLDVAGTDATLFANGSAGGNVLLTAGAAGGSLILNAPTSNAVQSLSGNVVVNADRMQIAVDSGITANSGVVTLRPATAGWEISLGSATDAAFALELSDAEVDRIFTPNLTIGSTTAGSIGTAGAFGPANAANVQLISGTDVFLTSAMTVTGALTIRAQDNVHFVTGSATTAGSLAVFVDQSGSDDAEGGVSSSGGAVTSGETQVSGNANNDSLAGTSGSDVISGLGGNDVINGGAGADLIEGGAGNDVLHGGGNGDNDQVFGGSGNDRITSTGEGSYFGEAGNDTIFAGLSTGLVDEVLDGGDGIDTLDTTSFTGAYTINLATGITDFDYESFINFENIVTGGGSDTITGTGGTNVIQTGEGDDVAIGGGGNDTLLGGLGEDTLRGQAGNDTVDGGEGGDIIDGGAGKDFLTGGLGADTFFFRDGDTANLRAQADRIMDFAQGEDTIQLNQIDANVNAGGNQAFLWIGDGAFTGVARQLRYLQANGTTFVEGDTDGDGAADVIIALVGIIDLEASNFIL
jgi:hypothetical protein